MSRPSAVCDTSARESGPALPHQMACHGYRPSRRPVDAAADPLSAGAWTVPVATMPEPDYAAGRPELTARLRRPAAVAGGWPDAALGSLPGRDE